MSFYNRRERTDFHGWVISQLRLHSLHHSLPPSGIIPPPSRPAVVPAHWSDAGRAAHTNHVLTKSCAAVAKSKVSTCACVTGNCCNKACLKLQERLRPAAHYSVLFTRL